MENRTDNRIKIEEIYHPQIKEIEIIQDVYQKYYAWRMHLSNSWKQFEGKSIREYISEARDKFNGVIPLDPTIKRKIFFSNEFRNLAEQVVLYISNLAQRAEFYGEEGLDSILATFLNAILKIIRKGSYWKILDALHYLQTIIDGTGIVYVSWIPKRRKLRNIKYIDLDTGEINFEEIEDRDDEIAEIWVDPLDFMIPKPWEIDIQKQGECIWRSIMTWSDFKRRYGGFYKSKYVFPGTMISDQSLYAEILDKTILSKDKVEILQYFNSYEDQYIIVANGIWLNPIKNKISPLPWNHKQLPFAKTIYKFTSPALFWGVSLVQSVKSEVEAFNELMEMSIDRIYKAINPPIITSDLSVPNNLSLESGKIYTSTGTWKELQMNALDPNVWNTTMILQNQMIRNTSPLVFPSPPSRQPKSASEILARQQRELQSFQIQKIFYQHLLEQKIWLEIQNALQFLTSKEIKRMVGESRYLKTLKINNVETPKGISNLEIRIVDKTQNTNENLFIESLIHLIDKKEKIEIIEIPIDSLKNLKFDVGITFDLENTPELKKTLFLQFVQNIMSLFPGVVDPKKVLIRLFEIWNENPADYLPENVIQSVYLSSFVENKEINKQPVQSIAEQLIQSQERGPRYGVQNVEEASLPIRLTDLINLGQND